MKPKVSVIVPVYKVEKYLKRCVESIINQTYKNLEILVIDDGSKDSSGDIADKYASVDSRVRVIHKKNEGLPQARKTGVENATGEYIGFVDADYKYEHEPLPENATLINMKGLDG